MVTMSYPLSYLKENEKKTAVVIYWHNINNTEKQTGIVYMLMHIEVHERFTVNISSVCSIIHVNEIR